MIHLNEKWASNKPIFRPEKNGQQFAAYIFQMDFPLRKLLSVCPSVRPSVCQSVCLSVCLCLSPFSLCSHYGIVMKFSGVITNDRSYVYAKVQCQRSKVKVTEVKTQISHFGTITPVWFHIWWWNDAQSLIFFRSGALLIFKVICQISRSHD